MPGRVQRARFVWLIMIGLLLSIVFFTGAADLTLQVTLAGIYGALAFFVLAGPYLLTLRGTIPNPAERLTRRTARPSKAAEVAEARARRQPGYRDLYRVIDTGMIISEVGREGMSLKRARMVSLNDQGIQPYVVLHAHPERADQTIVVRFEIVDHTGEVHYVNEDEVYIRQGENAVLASYRMPLRDNERLSGAGTWEMRILVDGVLIAMHSFGVGPSMAERRRLFTDDGELRGGIRDDVRHDRLSEDVDSFVDDDMPVSLEELLRGQSQSDD